MTLQECYAAMGADYDGVMGRLRSERLVQKFVLKFLDDGSYALLCSSLESGDFETAFRAAHTIKGMCQNLSFTTLAESASALTEQLRAGGRPQSDELFNRVREDYARTCDAICAFRAGLDG